MSVQVCNHPDLFEGRPIVSPLDVEPIDVHWPSLIDRLLSSRPVFGYGLETAIYGLNEKWDSEEIERLMTSWTTMFELGCHYENKRFGQELQDFHSLPNEGCVDPSVLQAIQSSIYNDHRLRIQERQSQLHFLYALNVDRCINRPFRVPLSLLQNPLPLWYRILNPRWIQSISHRALICDDLLRCFMCVIPKARALLPSYWVSRPDQSLVVRVKQKAERLRYEYNRRNGILWSALARSRLYFPDRRLIQFDCGKLQILTKLLRQLHSGRHRVLIFTQMSRVLDVLEEFLNIHGYIYLRLDGSTKADARQALMQRFNHDVRIFAFILSTRSGGIGVNLTGADTVIFYDSDWNPAMDKQAQDRCHRIGQTREVNIYRLVTKFTIEENILKKSEEKRQLDFLAIQSGEFNLQFLQRMNPTEIVEEAAGVGLTEEEIKMAMLHAEDETDAEAAKGVERETAAELEEFNQEGSLEESKDEELSDDEKTVSSETEPFDNQQIEFLLESCSPIEKFAVRTIEQVCQNSSNFENMLLDFSVCLRINGNDARLG